MQQDKAWQGSQQAEHKPLMFSHHEQFADSRVCLRASSTSDFACNRGVPGASWLSAGAVPYSCESLAAEADGSQGLWYVAAASVPMLAARLQGAAVSLGQNTTRQELVAGLRFAPHSKLTCVLVRGNHRVLS